MADFFLDHNVAYELAFHLRAFGHTARVARDLGLTRSRDHEILTICSTNQWIAITHNDRDFDLLHRAWQQWPVIWRVDPLPAHRGVLVLDPRLSARLAAAAIRDIIATNPDLNNRYFVRRANQDWTERITLAT